MIRSLLQLYFIMGSNTCRNNPLEVLDKALQAGITLFQFREKGLGAKEGTEKKQLALEMKALCRAYKVPFIVNDDVPLALEIEADGIHVGQEDENMISIRQKCPPDWIIGVSATNVREAKQAKTDGADYLGVGPIYSTSTKHDAKKPMGLSGLTEVRHIVGDTLPIVAIGGIQKNHIPDILKAGGDGVAVISAISQADSPFVAAAEMKEETQ
ncbi:thiamine phosphate synthase [Radiobacillus kanasensis]|uniref:thiamine phosphate synthase n=1 Tax=Radiobacillus kanasensis TaxID=2844358 RepID=UPI001E33B6AA|nr:thiamine phosphate synthase [Radiobacillus kanasensis]UFT98303.1 thiamine phosphate synthase [Radiobacillus kanasensis]